MKKTYFIKRRAMTLIEVIIAIAILAIMATTFTLVFSTNFKMLVDAKHFTIDTFNMQTTVEKEIEEIKNGMNQTPVTITNPSQSRLVFGKTVTGYTIKQDIKSNVGLKHGEINVYVANKKIEYDVPVVSTVSLKVSNLATEIDLTAATQKLIATSVMSTDPTSQDVFLMNVYKWYVSFENIDPTQKLNQENYTLFKEWNAAKAQIPYSEANPGNIPNVKLGYDEFKFSDYASTPAKMKELFGGKRYIRFSVTPYSKIGRIGEEKFSNPIFVKE